MSEYIIRGRGERNWALMILNLTGNNVFHVVEKMPASRLDTWEIHAQNPPGVVRYISRCRSRTLKVYPEKEC